VDLLPLGLLGLAAAVRPLRLPILVVLVLGFLVARQHGSRRTPAWAGAVPVAISLAWGLIGLPPAATDGSTCARPTSPFATLRLAEGVLTLGALMILVPLVGSGAAELGLRRPTRRVSFLAVGAFAICGPLGLLLGPALAEPFFGRVGIATSDPAAVVPALVFAIANGVMEEVAYRGALQAWTARVTGPVIAIAGQALVFGLAHTGPDVLGSPIPVVAAMTAGGLVAGYIVRRTGSLAVPIAVHVGLDIPLYYGNACPSA
jgi:membrane protease YdiL (CAAX protease family)